MANSEQCCRSRLCDTCKWESIGRKSLSEGCMVKIYGESAEGGEHMGQSVFVCECVCVMLNSGLRQYSNISLFTSRL